MKIFLNDSLLEITREFIPHYLIAVFDVHFKAIINDHIKYHVINNKAILISMTIVCAGNRLRKLI